MDVDTGEMTLTLVEGLKKKLAEATQEASGQVSLEPWYLRLSPALSPFDSRSTTLPRS